MLTDVQTPFPGTPSAPPKENDARLRGRPRSAERARARARSLRPERCFLLFLRREARSDAWTVAVAEAQGGDELSKMRIAHQARAGGAGWSVSAGFPRRSPRRRKPRWRDASPPAAARTSSMRRPCAPPGSATSGCSRRATAASPWGQPRA